MISVVIAVKDGARYLAEALASARAQDEPAGEIVVVDDGSSDDSAAIARATPGVRLIEQPHQGVAVARNRGVAEARGELIAFLDSDDVWPTEKLRVQRAFMIDHPEVGYSITHQRFRVEPGADPYRIPGVTDVAAEPPCAGTSSMMAWTKALARVGGFDPSLRNCEDTDWMARATQLGVVMGIVPATLLVRRLHDRNLSGEGRSHERDLLASLRASIARRGRAR